MTSKKIKEIFDKVPLDKFLTKNFTKLPKDLPDEIKHKLLNDSIFFSNYGFLTDTPEEFEEKLHEYKNKHSTALKDISLEEKLAYPNYDSNLLIQSPRSIDKWLNAMRKIYYQVHAGQDKISAFKYNTQDWSDMEKLDFSNWMKFYDQNSHKKYPEMKNLTIKNAQIGYWENAQRPGYFVPVHQQVDELQNSDTNSVNVEVEKRETIEKQRSKIISRLDSVEKLLRSNEGQLFAGKEFENLIHIIYELKKKIHTVNKVSRSNKIYQDLIIRQANICHKQGFVKSSQLLHSLADEVKDIPNTPQPNNPTNGGGVPGTLPGEGPGNVQPSNNNAPKPQVLLEDASKGMSDFLDRLDGSNIKKDDNKSEDVLEVIDYEDEDNEILVVEAQEAPQPVSPVAEEPAVQPSPDLEVEEELAQEDSDLQQVSRRNNYDDMMDNIFKDLKISDVVAKLEDLVKIFKTREIPRQLAMVDMMLDHLGLASFFPTLAEATNKSLDSNQYILTRLEDIVSRLRGTLKTRDIDLKSDNQPPPPETIQKAQQQLQQEDNKEKERKQMRKEIENESLQTAKPTPDIEVEEDLTQPVEVVEQPAQPTKTPPAI